MHHHVKCVAWQLPGLWPGNFAIFVFIKPNFNQEEYHEAVIQIYSAGTYAGLHSHPFRTEAGTGIRAGFNKMDR